MKHLLLCVLSTLLFLTACEELDPTKPGLLVPKTVDEDPSLSSISVNNTQLHSETFGDADDPMVVVLHGGPGVDYRSLLNCKAIAANGYYVIFYDQRGTGLSKRERKSNFSFQIMLDDLSAVIAHYRTTPQQKVILLGQSWGAMLATAYINAYPTAIQGAILAEPGGLVWKDIEDYVNRSRGYGLTSEILNDATDVDQFISGTESEQEKLDYKFALSSSPDVSSDDPVGNEGVVPFWRFGAIAQRGLFDIGKRDKPDWTTNLHSFNTKILFVYSERNKAYGSDYAHHVSSAYKNVQVEQIDGAGHDMMTFQTGWNNFLPLALTYLNELK